MPAHPLPPPPVAVLYADHHGWLQSWLRRKLGDAAQAQDLTHDTFVQLLTARNLPPLDNPRAYLTTMAKRTLFSFWRRRDLEQAYLDMLAAQPAAHLPSQEERYAIVQALQSVDRVLQSLPATARRVLLLNQLYDMPYREIALQLGIAEITVRRHMARAIDACCALDCATALPQ